MATLLTKDIVRECLAASTSEFPGRKLVVTLEAGDMISFRAKAKRFKYHVPLQAVYNMALIYTHNEIHKEKLDQFKIRKKAGMRCRKPKPLPRIFSAKYYEALKLK